MQGEDGWQTVNVLVNLAEREGALDRFASAQKISFIIQTG